LKRLFRIIAFLLAFFLCYPLKYHDVMPAYTYLNYTIPRWIVHKDKFYTSMGTIIAADSLGLVHVVVASISYQIAPKIVR